MIEAVDTSGPAFACAPESTAALLRYLTELAGTASPGPAEGILHELVRLFSARGAGIAFPRHPAAGSNVWLGDEPPAELPLRNQAERWHADGQAPLALHDAAGSWLVWCGTSPRSGEPALLWLNDCERHWSEQESAVLALAGAILRRAGVLGACADPVRDDGRRDDARRMVERLDDGAQLASRLSHDFGNVLTGVLGFAELAVAQVPNASLAHRYLTEVRDVARGGAEWLAKLNLFCRRHAPEFTPTSLAGAVAEEAAHLSPTERGRLNVELPADLPAIACDGDSLRQALRQVLDNAREATADDEPVALAARSVVLDAAEAAALIGSPAPGTFVEVVVTDAGPGIADAVRPRLLHEWFFSDKVRHRGLGLTIAYGIVRRFGGGLRIDAVPGGGTAVRLFLRAAHDPAPGGPAHVLIVDDDPHVLAEVADVLERAGHNVRATRSPAEALVLHQGAAEPFDLVIVAVHLPNLAGTDLARRMLLRDPAANFLFLHTPQGPPLPRDELLGPATLVYKPITPAALVQAVAATLGRRLGPRFTDRVAP